MSNKTVKNEDVIAGYHELIQAHLNRGEGQRARHLAAMCNRFYPGNRAETNKIANPSRFTAKKKTGPKMKPWVHPLTKVKQESKAKQEVSSEINSEEQKTTNTKAAIIPENQGQNPNLKHSTQSTPADVAGEKKDSKRDDNVATGPQDGSETKSKGSEGAPQEKGKENTSAKKDSKTAKETKSKSNK